MNPIRTAYPMMAKSDPGQGDDSIWSPHENPLIRKMIELFTQRGLLRLASVKKSILEWEGKSGSATMMPSPRPDFGMMTRWGERERELVRIYLDALPKDQWALDDHMLCVELVVQTYLPTDELITEAQWLATKATMMGKVENNWLKKIAPTLKQADAILAGLPNNPQDAAYFPMQPKERTTMEFANFRTVETVVNLKDNVRRQMRQTVARHVEKKMRGDLSGQSLQSDLLDTFGDLNRDWRRIAVTEAGEAMLQGMIAGIAPGGKVKRVEQYASACAFCKKIDGTIATVVSPDHPNKDPDTMIWEGKNNIGRSASPRKRVGNELVNRKSDEMYWLPAGLAHPHCRGRWVPVVEIETPQDPEFAAIVAEFLANT